MVLNVAKESNAEDFFNSHFVPCAKICFEMAKMQNLDVRLAVIIGLLHDYGKFFIKDKDNHEIVGASISKDILKQLGLNPNQINIICEAISNHKKDSNDDNLSKYSKLIINADIISYLIHFDYFYNYLIKEDKNIEEVKNITNRKIEHSKQRLNNDGNIILQRHIKNIKIIDELNFCK